ncbi:MAG: hypothetical protein Q6352_007040, partial [Candidatus Freyrarchaeum guaymaensis]
QLGVEEPPTISVINVREMLKEALPPETPLTEGGHAPGAQTPLRQSQGHPQPPEEAQGEAPLESRPAEGAGMNSRPAGPRTGHPRLSRVRGRGTRSPPAPRTAEESGSTGNREPQPNTRQSKRSKEI